MRETYTMNLAKMFFQGGLLTGYLVERAPMKNGWNIVLTDGKDKCPLVDARANNPRLFRTLDAAVKALEQIGFQVVSLK